MEYRQLSYKPQISVNRTRNFSLAQSQIAYRIFVTQQLFYYKISSIFYYHLYVKCIAGVYKYINDNGLYLFKLLRYDSTYRT